MATKIRLIHKAIRNSYVKVTVFLTLRNTGHAVNFEYCNNAAVLGEVRYFYGRIHWIFDDLQCSQSSTWVSLYKLSIIQTWQYWTRPSFSYLFLGQCITHNKRNGLDLTDADRRRYPNATRESNTLPESGGRGKQRGTVDDQSATRSDGSIRKNAEN